MLAIDPMHNLFLGTAKLLVSGIWIKREILNAEAIKVINRRICMLSVPPTVIFNRLPSSIEHSKSFAVEQWMVWTNYYSLYCLHGLLPYDMLECWRHFVLASRILSKYKLDEHSVKLADALKMQFCRRFQTVYGADAVTPNIHMHAHLVQCIVDFGPMPSFWLFCL